MFSLFAAATAFGKVRPMATNGQLLRKLATGQTLLESEIQQLERALNTYDNYSSILQSNTSVGGKEINVSTTFNTIYSTILDTDVASLEISIPGQYKHLLIVGQGRTNGTGGQTAISLFIRFNNDTSSNYMWGVEGQYNGANVLSQNTSATYGVLCAVVADGTAAGFAGATCTYIPHFNSLYYKQCLSLNAYNVAVPATYNTFFQTTWLDTSPITFLTILPDTAYASAKIEAGSLFSVYGIN